MVFDSGAIDNIMPTDYLHELPLTAAGKSKNGFYYNAATGGQIYNMGENTLEGFTNTGMQINMTFPSRNVRSTLRSAAQVGRAGTVVTLENEKSILTNKS